MKVVLINICLRPDTDKILLPVGLGYIASAISRAGHHLEIIDMDAHRLSFAEVEECLKNTVFDVVGFGCIVTGYGIVKKLASIVKKVNSSATVIVGNSVASSIPEILLQKNNVDIAVIGEGDNTIVDVLSCMESGGDLQSVPGIQYKKDGVIHRTENRAAIADIDSIPTPDWGLFDVELYLKKSKEFVPEPYAVPRDQIRSIAVNTARGCAFNCTFCFHVFKEDKYRVRSPHSIIEEIGRFQDKYAINYVGFWDELTLYSVKQTDAMMDAILASGLKFAWTGSCRGNLFTRKDKAVLKKMKKAGCIGLGFSLESANKLILKKMNKILDPEDMAEQTKALKEAGIETWTSLVIGYPDETEETIKETFDFCYKHDIFPSAGFLLPQPGTPIYHEARAMGFIPDEEAYLLAMGDRQDLRLNLTQIPRERLEGLISDHLARIRDKLNLPLTDEQLIKTGTYRSKSKETGQKNESSSE